jgi:hypothetical protein
MTIFNSKNIRQLRKKIIEFLPNFINQYNRPVYRDALTPRTQPDIN